MNSSQRLCAKAILYLAGSILFPGIPGQALAQATADQIPRNAEAKPYGDGWRCNPGYRESDGACSAVEIPANGYATSSPYGAGWECSYGFKESSGSCTPVRLPANAYLDPNRGDSWKCNRGYRAVDDTCVFIDVPANGYLTDSTYGADWECDRGYRANADFEPTAIHASKSGCLQTRIWITAETIGTAMNPTGSGQIAACCSFRNNRSGAPVCLYTGYDSLRGKSEQSFCRIIFRPTGHNFPAGEKAQSRCLRQPPGPATLKLYPDSCAWRLGVEGAHAECLF
jgi:hypothetical protein